MSVSIFVEKLAMENYVHKKSTQKNISVHFLCKVFVHASFIERTF